MLPTPTPAKQSTPYELLCVAVAATAAVFGLYRALVVVSHHPRAYAVRYWRKADAPMVALRDESCPRRALLRFERAIIDDQLYPHN